tara:strand:+ start:719 stop:1258 length:540 start_codon:yes stop_codon:yes gene_type:complete
MLIFDIETDGLLYNVTTIHCLVIYDTETNQTMVFNDQAFDRATDQPAKEPITRGIQLLMDADCISGHNILSYDIPVICKLYPWFERPTAIVDTLLLSRLYHANMIDLDKRHNWDGMPLKLYGRHSLESYGHRLKCLKGDYGKATDWKEWSAEMQDYCANDVKVTTKLWDHFQPYLSGSK